MHEFDPQVKFPYRFITQHFQKAPIQNQNRECIILAFIFTEI